VSIRLKILMGCLCLTFITVSLGLYMQVAQRQLGHVATQIYDDTVMAISYLRSAQNGLGPIERELLRTSAKGGDRPNVKQLLQDVAGDLQVAKSRAMSPAGKEAADIVSDRLAELARPSPDKVVTTTLAALDQAHEAFDSAVEVYAADGYRYRRRVGNLVDLATQRTRIAIGFAIIAALGITFVLSRSIIPALQDAVRLAQSIAAGRLDNPIVVHGRSEPARLLQALGTMQTAIGDQLQRIETLLDAQQYTHTNELEDQHSKLEAALDSMGQGLCLFGPDNRLVVANKRFVEMFGATCLGSLPDDMLQVGIDPVLLASLADERSITGSHTLGNGLTIAVSRRRVERGGWVVTFDDVTEQRVAAAKLVHMARHDVLTGLPNRLLLSEHMPAALARARRSGGLAVLCLDLDRFKIVNDTLGHGAGDLLLQAVSDRLVNCMRETDLIARLGGDEFAVVQEPCVEAADAFVLANRIIEALAHPFDIDGQQVIIGTSVGVALFDGTATSPEALLKCADLALYRAKADRSGSFRVFEDGMDSELLARRELELDLRKALRCGEFEVFYQPLMAKTEGIVGFEALIRWHHPVKGLINPATFISIAEETGLIGAIGDWVLRQATADAASWPASLKVAVNLSPIQFKEKNLVGQVKAALAASGLRADRLELEITESVLMQEDMAALEMLHKLRALGVRIAMDDFGTGYSSLSYLRRFPFDKIKIDQSFVRNMNDSNDCLAIIKAVIGLGRSLNIAVNAEGVENAEQLAALRSEGCSEMQGYLFSKPQPAASIPGLLLHFGLAETSTSLCRVSEGITRKDFGAWT